MTRTDTLSWSPAAIIRTTNEEAAAWAETTAFRKEILGKPWDVSEADEKRARRKAEGLDREKRARGERKKRKRYSPDKVGAVRRPASSLMRK